MHVYILACQTLKYNLESQPQILPGPKSVVKEFIKDEWIEDQEDRHAQQLVPEHGP